MTVDAQSYRRVKRRGFVFSSLSTGNKNTCSGDQWNNKYLIKFIDFKDHYFQRRLKRGFHNEGQAIYSAER